MAEFIAFSGVTGPACPVKVTTTTAIKTLLQVQTPTTRSLTVIEWGVFFDGSAAGAPFQCELVDTLAIAATVTTHSTSTVNALDANDGMVSQMTMGTAATGYNASAEGTVAANARLLDHVFVAPSAGYKWQFPLGQQPRVGSTAAARNLRVRVTGTPAVNATCYIIWDEH